MSVTITPPHGITITGTSVENEPIIKSDGASSDVMEWQASTGTSTVKVREDASNNMDLLVNGVPVTGGASGSTNDGQGLHFDGAAGYIDIASPPDLGTKFSMEFIVQASSYSAGVNIYLVDFDGGGAARFVFGNSTANSGNLAIYDKTAWRVFSPAVKVIDDLAVHHLIVTVDGSTATLYDNGNQIATATGIGAHNIDGATDANIGRSVSVHSWLDGTLYRTRFWNKTLSQADVTASYENATVPFADQYGSMTEMVVNGDFASATGWVVDDVAIGSNVATWSAGSAQWLRRADWVLTKGKSYRLSFETTTHTATGTIRLYNYNATAIISDDIEINAAASYTLDFVAQAGNDPAAPGCMLGVYPGAGTFAGVMDNLSCVEIGVVSDYDLAFANPTQSLMVQDRAGAADGTSSATGVVQVTKLEQVNTNKLSVGGVTPKVGIGLAAGVTPDGPLHIQSASAGSVSPHTSGDDVIIEGSDHTGMSILSADAKQSNIYFGTPADSSGALIRWDYGSGSTNFMQIGTAISGGILRFMSGDHAEAMRIDESRRVGIGCTPDQYAKLHTLTEATDNQLRIEAYRNDVGQTSVRGYYSRGTAASPVIVNNNDTVFGLQGWAGDGTDHHRVAEIDFQVDGTPGNDDTPGRLVFSTTADGATNPTERMRIDSAGLATFSNGIACSGGGNTNTDYGQIKSTTSVTITAGSSITMSGSNANGSLVTVYEGGSGKCVVFMVSYANVVIISDPGSTGSLTDVSDKFCMLGGGSHTCTLKNGFASSKGLTIMAMGSGLT